MRQNRSVPDVKEKRKSWREHLSENDADHLVFLDESGVNTDMTRHYARSKKNERAVDSTPVNTPCNTTILFSVRLNGKTCHTVYCGGTTMEWFAEYLKTMLIPALSKTDIIVMDNMRSHHAKIVKQVLDESGINDLYLPPYSPDLNPIEKMWSKLKAYLRKEKVRIASELPPAIERAFSTVRASDCLGWFGSCNYVQ
ncbi:IS630 family transposase [Mediterraneibacter gnavus]|uniref:IS630 family transposase n=1 Tax=Mediterraneibacter gnavus TaxID=33038 RepID=UPI0013B04AB4|nr:IS630 family transposase [Mediterraneibacter gnavus]MDB8711511.1 IS630 family transposase [Mediterraneibacter gnavus]MDB8713261.1 IS630 family transposase [Mediterraneibacter gnavus]